jgi:peptidyl-prolyl cis-trans isomerase D
MLVFGREQGIGASKRLVDGEIASIPAFQNLAGQFDQTAFQAALRNERITEQQLRDDLASTLIQRQIMVPVAGSPHVPGTMAQRYASLLLEQRQGSVGLVSSEAVAGALSADRRGGECVLHEQPQPLHDPGTAGDPLRLVR